jgi:uncharacterized membrane protein
VSVNEWLLLFLQLAHALAAMAWLGGGVYLLLVLGPAIREQGAPTQAFLTATSERFRDWAQVATIVMVVTGAVLMFDRLSNNEGGLLYAVLLGAKVIAAIAAFWLAGVRPVRRAIRRRESRRAAPELIVLLGTLAFLLGVGLSSVYGQAT